MNGKVRFMTNMYLDVTHSDGVVHNQFFGFGELHPVDSIGICANGYVNVYFPDGHIIKGIKKEFLELHKNPTMFDDTDDEQQVPEIEEAPIAKTDVAVNIQQHNTENVISSLEEELDHPEIPIEGLENENRV